MKIENGTFLDQAEQMGKPFSKARVATEFAEVAKTKADEYGKSVRMGQAGYDKDELTGKGAIEEIEEQMSGQMDATARKNQMAVLANTMTPEDYRKAQEDGFSIRSTDSGTIVTVTDKIKAQLAKAGVDISGMGDALTKEQMEEIAGSLAAASQLERSFAMADLPATKENMTEGLEAFEQAGELAPLSKGTIKYMLDNHLDPSIANLYMAEFSGSAAYAAPAEEIEFESLREQVEHVIMAAGREVNEQTLADSEWMIQSGIALTAENFSYMEKLAGLKLPLDKNETAQAIATAVAEGGRPGDAMLLPEYTLAAQAEHAVEVVTEASDEDIAYLVSNHMELSVENLEQAAALRKQGAIDPAETRDLIEAGSAAEGADVSVPVTDSAFAFLRAKRVLEETRLAMTTEANRALLKRGISIDTKPLEALVEKLKAQESDYYAALLGESSETKASPEAALFEETAQKVSDLKQMPAYLLGMREYSLHTVNELHEAGHALQSAMEAAGESYEALMTAPRSDLGDSIQKAFANVDDILRDLGLEENPANERAVRILAYNRLEINEESVQTMKAADERVQRAFSNLTPATVRELIRQGSNPLDMDLDLLNKKAEAIRVENGETETERFSEYLWKLEQNQGISPQERESFIGVYRLIHQIEKTDGAAIGALVSQGAELTMRNLLTAVRSAKKSGMDYTVDDDFAGVDAAGTGRSITDQIETAYQADCMKDAMETLTPVVMRKLLESPDWENYTPEQLKQALAEYALEMQEEEQAADDAYLREQVEELKQAAASDDEVYRFLTRYELPNTVENILAANRLLNRRNQVFSQVFNSDDVFSGEQVDFDAIKEEILERFAHALSAPKEMAEAQEALAETAENVMKTMIQDEEGVTSMDIREMKLMNTQLSIAGKMAKEEEYAVPIMIGGEVTNVSLKIVRGTKRKGIVDIMFETKKAGKVAASIEAKEKGVSGYVAADQPETKRLLEANMPEIAKGFGEGLGDLQVTYVSKLNFSRFSEHAALNRKADENGKQEYEAQTGRLYQIAKSFLESVKELDF